MRSQQFSSFPGRSRGHVPRMCPGRPARTPVAPLVDLGVVGSTDLQPAHEFHAMSLRWQLIDGQSWMSSIVFLASRNRDGAGGRAKRATPTRPALWVIRYALPDEYFLYGFRGARSAPGRGWLLTLGTHRTHTVQAAASAPHGPRPGRRPRGTVGSRATAAFLKALPGHVGAVAHGDPAAACRTYCSPRTSAGHASCKRCHPSGAAS
jgi:hypothetical protein